MARKLGIIFVVLGLIFVVYRMASTQSSPAPGDQQATTAAPGAQPGATATNNGIAFPGKGSQTDWNQAVGLCKQGNAYLVQKNYDQAISLYQQATEKYPDDPAMYNVMAVIYFQRNQPGDLQTGEDLLKKAISLKPNDCDLWNNLGKALAQENKITEAREALVKASQCNPNPAQSAEIQQNIGALDAALQQSGGS